MNDSTTLDTGSNNQQVEIDDEPNTLLTSQGRQRRGVLFVLKAKEERMLTQSTLNGMIEDITGL